jgi:subtilisin family serine protease
MVQVKFGRRDEPAFELQPAADLLAVRTRSRRSMRGDGRVRDAHTDAVTDAALVAAYPEAGVEVFKLPSGRGAPSLSARKSALRASPDVRFAGGVLVEPNTGSPVLYTENLFVKFTDDTDADVCLATLATHGLTVKEEVGFATNGYFVGAPEGIGQQVFDLALDLLARRDVEYCHPELIRKRERKAIAPQQWHLTTATINGTAVNAHANVASAHELTRGADVTIAIIDDGVDIDHAEFRRSGKVIAPRDATLGSDDPRPKDSGGYTDDHGTACAGVACADGVAGASGVAPAARLMPIRLASGLGSMAEANAFRWAADHGADVISCSWGPADGNWSQPSDPQHNTVVALPASTRLAIDYAVNTGRGGRGCVICFAAGNGNESVDNDGYASYAKVIAVAACNDTGKRSVYSDFGRAVWCAFPSSDFGYAPFQQPRPLTPGIWTTDRSGNAGYNHGSSGLGDSAGNYANDFGGTSSACPGVAGVAALVLATNPELKFAEVKDVLKRACDRIDPQGGAYDANGHSKKYGYGRINARTAVELAAPQTRPSATFARTYDQRIPDLQTIEVTLAVSEAAPVASVRVSLELLHTYIGDLIVTLVPPAGIGVGDIVLHNRSGGAARNLLRTYDASQVTKLGQLAGKSCAGTWKLRIRDAAAVDEGKLVRFGIELGFGAPRDVAAPRETDLLPRRAPRGRAPRRSARRAATT